MDRRPRQRISKLEKLLSAAKRECERKRKKFDEDWLRQARLHATAVAAIVLSGKPKIDEPLSRAWTRALQHYQIETRPLDTLFRPSREETPLERQVAAAKELVPLILPITLTTAQEPARFTEIFKTAPVWLLNFTSMSFDAGLLKFDLPDQAWPAPGTQWGRTGYDESRQWPLLPSGTMTDGDRVPYEHAKRWPLPLDTIEQLDKTEDLQDNSSQSDEDNHSPAADLLADLILVLDVAENPERELSRYEKVRLRHALLFLQRTRDARLG
jgi:hypothetical protein